MNSSPFLRRTVEATSKEFVALLTIQAQGGNPLEALESRLPWLEKWVDRVGNLTGSLPLSRWLPEQGMQGLDAAVAQPYPIRQPIVLDDDHLNTTFADDDFEYDPMERLAEKIVLADGIRGLGVSETSLSWIPLNKKSFFYELNADECPRVRATCVPSVSRSFKVGIRKDMRGVINETFRTLGLCEVTDTPEADIYWDHSHLWTTLGDYMSPSNVRPGMMVNSIPTVKELIGVKDGLVRVQAQCYRAAWEYRHTPRLRHMYEQSLCAFTMPAVNIMVRGKSFGVEGYFAGQTGLNALYELVSARFHAQVKKLGEDQNQFQMLLIVKPEMGWNSAGIYHTAVRLRDLDSQATVVKMIRRMNLPEGGWTVQEMLHPPLRYQGKKFDVRVWALVTSLNPLRMYIMDAGVPKIATKDYNISHPAASEKCALFRMMLTQGCSENYLVSPYPRRTTNLGFQRNLLYRERWGRGSTRKKRTQSARPGREETGEEAHDVMPDPDWTHDVWPDVVRKMVLPIMHIRDQV